MSFSQFAKELKEAADNGIGYTLESCYITYDLTKDKEYIPEGDGLYRNSERWWTYDDGDRVLRNIYFKENTKVNIRNCQFGTYNTGRRFGPVLIFEECTFSEFDLFNVDVNAIILNKSKINYFRYYCGVNSAEFRNHGIHLGSRDSEIKNLAISDNSFNKLDRTNLLYSSVMFIGNKLGNVSCSLKNIHFENNKISRLSIQPYIKDSHIKILDNKFDNGIYPTLLFLEYNKEKEWMGQLPHLSGCKIQYGKIDELTIAGNIFEARKSITNEEIINSLLTNHRIIYEPNRYAKSIVHEHNTTMVYWKRKAWDEELMIKDENNTTVSLSDFYNTVYHDSMQMKERIVFFSKYFKENNITLSYPAPSLLEINKCEINSLRISKNNVNFFEFKRNIIKENILIEEMQVDSLTSFFYNTMPDYNRVSLDKTILNNLGFKLNHEPYAFDYKYKIFHGDEKFTDIDTTNLKRYNQSTNLLTSQYRQFINILHQKGDELKNKFVMKLKDIQTNQKMFIYYMNPNTNSWFNWKGSEFLKWYSDYGMNPFKALAYCFWAMIYFALFYFFFYSDWDKIDRGFLIKRFNSVMDYFTTEKRIEDFYSSTHDKEMTTFSEFKETLEKNKVHMPSMLASLAKPIYQMSLLRYKLLNFSYKKAEFMAGRKWVDLKKKDRYLIGTLTFFLTITYIIYLIFIRALNSIALSVNAFSTLGFGQIPVKGFTKYVAIIEGFIGWFMLSVFIVSLLSQMMSV